MTRVDFYVLSDVDLTALQRFACRLAFRAAGAGQGVHLHLADESAVAEFDALLWDYPSGRFLPHETVPAGGDHRPRAPVSLGHDLPRDCDGVLINLAPGVPEFFARFDRVAEIIVGATKADGRSRYKHYRDRGYPLHHHDIDDWENDGAR